jgi:hypothetical protein
VDELTGKRVKDRFVKREAYPVRKGHKRGLVADGGKFLIFYLIISSDKL